jgi:hypothetical protein
MRRPALPTIVLGSLLASVLVACGPSATPVPTAAPTPTEAPATPTVAPTVGPSGDLANLPYEITIPAGWQAYDLSDPTAKAGLDAFIEANPGLGAAIQQFASMPGVRMAVNPLLGNFMLIVTTPSNGIPLDTLGQSFTAIFQTVPGLQGTPTPENLTLPGGDAIHWTIKVAGNKPGGGSFSVDESVYLLASASDAVILEFVTLSGGAIPDERAIVDSFRFKG